MAAPAPGAGIEPARHPVTMPSPFPDSYPLRGQLANCLPMQAESSYNATALDTRGWEGA